MPVLRPKDGDYIGRGILLLLGWVRNGVPECLDINSGGKMIISNLRVTALLVLAGLTLTACGSPSAPVASNGDRQTRTSQPSVQVSRPPVKHYAEGYEPTDEEIEAAVEESREELFGKRWSCYYEPTMNENWHDDVRCTNGPKSYRPILLADRGFVTEEEMRAAGRDHEKYLNSLP